jgi:MerR family transcriptional regulator, redox-sensitive transcriptional activator SoxR
MAAELTIGELSARTGVAASALRYYETEELIHSTRSPAGQRRYPRETIRRVSFIRVAQQVGLSLHEIRAALARLPGNRTPGRQEWQRLSAAWRPRLDAQIALLERLRDGLDSCIGCGCLSLATCRLFNPDDVAAGRGPGPRFIVEAGGPHAAGAVPPPAGAVPPPAVPVPPPAVLPAAGAVPPPAGAVPPPAVPPAAAAVPPAATSPEAARPAS